MLHTKLTVYVFSIRPAVNAMCSSSSTTRFPISSDVVSTNVTLPTVLVSVDSASNEELLCKSDKDSKVECDADTDSQSDTAVDNCTIHTYHLCLLSNEVII